jgi:hypothetical protein
VAKIIPDWIGRSKCHQRKQRVANERREKSRDVKLPYFKGRNNTGILNLESDVLSG